MDIMYGYRLPLWLCASRGGVAVLVHRDWLLSARHLQLKA